MRKVIVFILCIMLGVCAFILINKINGDVNVDNSSTQKKTTTLKKETTTTTTQKNTTTTTTQKENNTVVKTEKKNETLDFSSVPSFKEENSARYLEYKNKNEDLDAEEIVMRVNVYLDYAFYQKDIDAINKNTPLILVNKYYYIDETYVPNNLVEVSTSCASGGGIYADSDAVTHFTDMCTDAKALNLNIKTISAYRSYNYQKALYEGYLKNDTVASVDTYSARPGHSEHQTGYAFDVYNLSVTYTNFGSTNEFKWVKINAHKYGFIIRYTKENSYITGYKNEPWHLRYVGINAATYIYEHNITLEEYLLNKN